MQNENIETQEGGRAYPEAMDGLPENANEKENIALVENENKESYNAIPKAKPSKALDSAITLGVEKIITLKADRALINAQIKEVVEGLEGRGILRDALTDTIKKMEWTEAKRESYALGCKISGNALGIMEQTELFSVN